MPREWIDTAKSIREKNPDMPRGQEWAIATEQYKKKHGHPPRRHKSALEALICLADLLDEKGLYEEASLLDKVATGMKFDPMKNPLPSKVKEILDNPVFRAAIKANDFVAAKDLALSVIMESEIKEEDKVKILQNIERIENTNPTVAELQKYLYNSWLKYIGLGVVGELLVFADNLDKKELFNEADLIDRLIVQSGWFFFPELEKSRRPFSLPVTPKQYDPGLLCPECGTNVFSLNKSCPECGYVSKEKQEEKIEEL